MAKLPPEAMGVFGDPEGSTKMMTTVSKDFKVNVVVIGSFFPMNDETLIFADMFLKKTKQNLADNPRVAVTAVKPDAGTYEVIGTLKEWQTTGPLYSMVADMIYQRMPVQIHGVGVVQVDEVYSISPTGEEQKLA